MNQTDIHRVHILNDTDSENTRYELEDFAYLVPDNTLITSISLDARIGTRLLIGPLLTLLDIAGADSHNLSTHTRIYRRTNSPYSGRLTLCTTSVTPRLYASTTFMVSTRISQKSDLVRGGIQEQVLRSISAHTRSGEVIRTTYFDKDRGYVATSNYTPV